MRNPDAQHQIIVVGAGISGCVLAERFANQCGKRVLVIEKRDEIGGNCFDFTNEAGHLIPKYGPHFFHTNFEDVWTYVQNFSEWTPYEHRALAYVDGKYVPVPVNIETVNQVFGLSLTTREEMEGWLAANTEKIPSPKNSEESGLARAGKVLYEKIFKGYTKKQWDRWPHELDASVLDRIPVRSDADDRYFTDKYQSVPKDGYTQLFKNMLDNPLITIRLNANYLEEQTSLPKPEKLFFTGPIDQFF